MLIFPWDAAFGDEWRRWLPGPVLFGQLAVNNAEPDGPPLVIPTHAALTGGQPAGEQPTGDQLAGDPRTGGRRARDEGTSNPWTGGQLVLHLARVNPVLEHLRARPRVLFSVVGDDAYVPGTWRNKNGAPPADGVPTSYYAAVQFVCDAELVEETEAKAELLREQMHLFNPDGEFTEPMVGEDPHGRLIPQVFGLRLHIVEVNAKFKYDDDDPREHRERVTALLDERGTGHDAAAAAQQQRRLAELGEWVKGSGFEGRTQP